MPGFAAVRQVQSGSERRFQQRLSGGHPESAAVRLDPYAVFLAQSLRLLARSPSRAVHPKGLDFGGIRIPKGPRAAMFTNPPAAAIDTLLRRVRSIAVVGLSADPTRPSHGVARALQRFGYRIIPVTPAAEAILGEIAVPSLEQLPEVLGPAEQVDLVDVFRRPEHVAQSWKTAFA